MKEIQLSKGLIALIDDSDFEAVSIYKWFACRTSKRSKTHYAFRNTLKNGKRSTQTMHRFILQAVDSKIHVDHINGDGLDNRRSNIRLASQSNNMKNRGASKNNILNIKGVSFDKKRNMFMARLNLNGDKIWLGRFKTAEEASRVYEMKAKEVFGEFYRGKE